MTMQHPSDVLRERGIELPQVPAPVAAYVPAVRCGDLVMTSGQLPFVDGTLRATGKVGGPVDVAEAAQAARAAALNALAAAAAVAGGIDHIVRIVKVVGFVASEPGFVQQPKVVDGASELFGEIFGEAGAHARSAVGVAELPLSSPVEIELIVQVAAAATD